jgi:hypothetical protein
MIAVSILSLVGLFFLGLGFLIWYFKLAGLIAGYDPQAVTDSDALAKWTGKCMMVTGGIALLIGMGRLFFESQRDDEVALMLFMFTSMTTMVVMLAGMHRFTK